ncbi:hypothetical protein EDD85DRAFT_794596 [Armillaria nabsnona]|nr:hypothetical protein EDD85DRAFT_794596 [Armillaria nabsnona]
MTPMDLATFGSVTAFTDKDDPFRQVRRRRGLGAFLHNNFGPGLLAIHLVPKMIETARGFGIHLGTAVVASDVHYWTMSKDELVGSPNILAKLSSKEYCTLEIMKRRYFDSKLLNVLFPRAFWQCLLLSTIAVNSVNPGFCISKFCSMLPEGYQEADAKQEAELAFTTEDSEGGRQLVFSAVGGANCEDKLRGACISLSEVVEERNFVIGKDVQDNVSDEMKGILDGVDSKVVDVIRQYLKNWKHEVPLRSKGESSKWKLGLLAVVQVVLLTLE